MSEFEQDRGDDFDEDDRILAAVCLHVYMFEVNGAGIRWQFDAGGHPATFLDNFVRFNLEREIATPDDELQRRLTGLRGLVEGLRSFVDRPISHPSASSDHENSPSHIQRMIDPTRVERYEQFRDAYEAYVEELEAYRSGEATRPDIYEAAVAVSYAEDPESWNAFREGRPIDHDVRYRDKISNTDERWYLEAVMAHNAKPA